MSPKEEAGDSFTTICRLLVTGEDVHPGDRIVVLDHTRPVLALPALQMVYSTPDLTPSDVEPAFRLEESLRSSFVPTPVRLPEALRCNFRLSSREFEEIRTSNEFLVELSNIIANPFDAQDPGAHGRFLRFSLAGGPGASWYWLPLTRKGEEWVSGEPVRLPISDG